MAERMELWSLRPPVAVPSLPLASASVRYETKNNDEDEATAGAIARIALAVLKSLEESRGAQTLTLLQQAHVPGILPAALLECDVLRTVGDVVLNERHWWADRSDNAAWKTKKRQIAMRVVRGALQDVAVHVVYGMAPLAKEIAETTKPQDLKLSLLVDQWPKGFSDVVRAAACGEEVDSKRHGDCGSVGGTTTSLAHARPRPDSVIEGRCDDGPRTIPRVILLDSVDTTTA